ncbi:Dps family protein [Candidatus Stoquefichus massiliensis]|uniref:Dps family protein n=1 Tax=Candidatus Stoquefichus massiliensis TaxID=1470350 RepID=UPI0004876537|nr:DNA starvation/stationary phase protection protein [Candidatus Stoquefichus massiliensis]
MEKQLNHLLADFAVEYHKLQNYHWYIKGKDFFNVHAKLEEYYNYINGGIDDIAEKILMIGGKPIASMSEFIEYSQIKEAQDEAISSHEIYQSILLDFQILLDSVKKIKSFADESDEYLISSAMDSYIEEFSKSIWMIKQVIQ